MNNKKILSGLLLLSIVFSLFPTVTITKANTLDHIPAFPEDLERAETDWVEFDWYGNSVLPEDRMQYLEEYESLIEEGKYEEAASLEMKKTLMYDEESYNFYKVPREVQEVVTTHMDSQNESTLQSIDQKDLLKDKIAQALASRNTTVQSIVNTSGQTGSNGEIVTENSEDFIHNDDNLPKLDLSNFTTIYTNASVDSQLQNISNLSTGIIESEENSSQIGLQSTLPNVMDYYDGIENNVIEYALYSLSNQQNNDGSIGTIHKSRNTFAFLNMMENIYRTNTLEYQKAQSYFVNLEPKNNIEKIYKISVLSDKSQDYVSLKTDLDSQFNTDNGLGIIAGYHSDIYTTLTAAELYGKLGDLDNYTKTLDYLLPKIENDGSIKYESLLSSSDRYLSYKMLEVLNLGTFAGKQSYVDKLEGFLENTEDITHTFDTALTSLYFEDKRDFESVELYQNHLEYYQKNDGLFGDILTSIYSVEAIAKADIVGVDITTTGTVQHYSPANMILSVKNIGYKPSYNVVFEKYVNNLQTGGDIQANITQLVPNITANINFTLENTIKYKGDTAFDFFVKSDNEKSGKNNWVSKEINFINSAENKARFPDYYIAYSHETSNGHGFNIRWNNDYIDSDLSKYVIMFRKKGETQWYGYDASPDKNGYFIPAGNIGDIYEVTLGIKNIHNSELQSYLTPSDVIISDNDTPVVSNISGNISIDGFTGESMKIYGYGVSHTTDFDGSFSANFKQGKNIIMIDDDRYKSFRKYIHVGDGVDQYDFTLNTRLVPDSDSPIVTNLKVNNGFQLRHNREVPIDISVTDNIDVKDVDLYYFDPSYNAWIYIDNVDVPYSQVEYLWNIDETYLGKGYKVKAIASDWSGNKSESIEYGPFNIISPLGPDGTVVVDVDTVKLGETINFSVNPGQSFDRYSKIEFLYEDSSRTILRDIDPSERNFTYTIPYSSKYISQNAQISARICDINNNCEDILSNPFIITDVNFSLPDNWKDQKDISFSMNNGDFNRGIYFIDKTDDTIEIVYDEYYKYTGKQEKIIYRKYSNGSWGPQVTLKDFDNYSKDDNYLQYRSIQVRKSGEYIGIIGNTYHRIDSKTWQEEDNMREVVYMVLHNGTKIIDKVITNNNTLSNRMEMAIDNNGVGYIGWEDDYDALIGGEGQEINFYHTTVSNTGNIGTIYTLDGWKSHVDIYNTGENIILGYRDDNDQYNFKYYDGINNNWNPSQIIFDATSTSIKYIYEQNNNTYVFFEKDIIGGIDSLNVLKLSYLNGNMSQIYEKNIYTTDEGERLLKSRVKQNPNGGFHITTKKEFQLDGRYVEDLRYISFNNDTVGYNYTLAPLTTDFNGWLYLSVDGDNVYVVFSSEVSNIDKFRYFTGTFTQDNSNEFGFPEFDIDVKLSLDEFRITFFFLGYKFSFWIDLF